MNSYEETLVETIRNLIDLHRLQASLKDIDVAIDAAEALLEAGPEEFEQ